LHDKKLGELRTHETKFVERQFIGRRCVNGAQTQDEELPV